MNFDKSYPWAALDVIYMAEIDENLVNWGGGELNNAFI